MIKKIGIDCDGVICCFNTYFSTLLRQLYGNHIPILKNKELVSNWNWWENSVMPLTKEQIDKGWEIFDADPDSWVKFDPVNQEHWERFVKELNDNPLFDIYFITARRNTGNASAMKKTVQWLEEHGWKNPQVIVGENKGLICKALGIDIMIDDSGRNCADILEVSKNTTPILMDYPHSRKSIYSHIKRVNDLNEFIDEVLNQK